MPLWIYQGVLFLSVLPSLNLFDDAICSKRRAQYSYFTFNESNRVLKLTLFHWARLNALFAGYQGGREKKSEIVLRLIYLMKEPLNVLLS